MARAGLSFAACTGAGSALAPHDSLRYWTQVAYQPARIGGLAFASDQSILGTLARLGLVGPARTWLWLTLGLLVAALTVTGMRGRPQQRPGNLRPVAQRRSRVADLAHLLVTPLGLGGPRAAHLPQHRQPESLAAIGVRAPGPAHLRDRTTLAAALRGWPRTALVLVAAGRRRLLRPDRAGCPHPRSDHEPASRPKRSSPGTAGTPTASHGQELRPVPSRTRDDASVPART